MAAKKAASKKTKPSPLEWVETECKSKELRESLELLCEKCGAKPEWFRKPEATEDLKKERNWESFVEWLCPCKAFGGGTAGNTSKEKDKKGTKETDYIRPKSGRCDV